MKAVLDEDLLEELFFESFRIKDSFSQRRSIEKNLILAERAGIEPMRILQKSLNDFFDKKSQKKLEKDAQAACEYKCTCNRTFKTLKALNGHGYKNCKRDKVC